MFHIWNMILKKMGLSITLYQHPASRLGFKGTQHRIYLQVRLSHPGQVFCTMYGTTHR